MHTETETPTHTPTPATTPSPAQTTTPSHAARIAPSSIDVELIAKQRSEHSARMSRYWQDPEWRDNLTKKMKAYRSQKRVKARMRDKLLDSARERVRKTGVLPQWTPKKVAALEPSGKWIVYDSIRQCAAHYGVKESNMRALIKFKRTWNGMRFVVSVEK